MVGNENWAFNATPEEEFLFIIGILQPFVLLTQLLCSTVRWADHKKTIGKRLIVYWIFLALYMIFLIISICFSKWQYIEIIYFSYWILWVFYWIAVIVEIHKKKLLEIIKWGF